MKIQYQPTTDELATASIFFLEKKPFVRLLVIFANIVVGFVVIALLLSLLITHMLNLQQWTALLIGSFWLFGRKRFHRWILSRRMQTSAVIGKNIVIDVSPNGIIWSGTGLVPGNLSWEPVKYILETPKGFILPNTFTRFLWLPFHGFESSEAIDDFRKLLVEKKIVCK